MNESLQDQPYPWSKYGKIVSGVLVGWFIWFCMLILVLRWVNPPFTSFTCREDWKGIGKEPYNLRETWHPEEKITQHLKLAVIASEDQRFYSHWGVDLSAIEKAIEDNRRKDRLRGASTLTQQVAKNLFLTSAKSYLRKGVEAGIAILIDLLWSKERILEVYINIAEFGPGMYGITKASRHYYDKEPEELSPEEAAKMVTALPSPFLIEPVPASKYVEQRSKWILRNMQQLSGIQYLPEIKMDTADILPPDFAELDSLLRTQIQDSLILYPDSVPDSSSADTLRFDY